MEKVRRLLRRYFASKLAQGIGFVIIMMLLGAFYPGPDATRLQSALYFGGGTALFFLLISWVPHLLGLKGRADRYWGYTVVIITLMTIGALSSPSSEPWWLSMLYPVAFALIPITILETVLSRQRPSAD